MTAAQEGLTKIARGCSGPPSPEFFVAGQLPSDDHSPSCSSPQHWASLAFALLSVSIVLRSDHMACYAPKHPNASSVDAHQRPIRVL